MALSPANRCPQPRLRTFAPHNTCRCCDRHIFDSADRLCGYCAARPEQGGCLGHHGEALRAYLDDCCAHGGCTAELADWWMGQDAVHLTRHRVGKNQTKST